MLITLKRDTVNCKNFVTALRATCKIFSCHENEVEMEKKKKDLENLHKYPLAKLN